MSSKFFLSIPVVFFVQRMCRDKLSLSFPLSIGKNVVIYKYLNVNKRYSTKTPIYRDKVGDTGKTIRKNISR